jgi:ribosomal protein S18 acetylase RimI-like enzyme
MKENIDIIPVTEYSKEVEMAISRLLKHLTKRPVVFSKDSFDKILAAENSNLIIARDSHSQGKIIGMLSYVTFIIPTGINLRIEDVVVDKSVRGKGIGRELMLFALAQAQQIGADKVDLTSSPERLAANKLYQSLGFKIKETNVYRLDRL